jgi:hypothetical protein
MAHVEITPAAEADIRRLVLEPEQRLALVIAIIQNLSFMPARHPACPAAGNQARKYNEGSFLVLFDVNGPAGTETVTVLLVLPARGRLAAQAVT